MSGTITRILIVEDERITAEDLRISLKNLGYDVVGAVATGQDAISTAQQTRPDLVLMDIILKGKMSGIEATMRIQTDLDIPVVYLTAFSDESTIMRLRESKPFGYLQKPFDDKELSGVIETALEKFRILKALRESREWFSVTLRSIGDAVICTNMESRISLINPAAVTLTGWSEDKAMDRPLNEVFRIVNEENDQPIEDPAVQVLKQGHVKGLAGRTLLIAKDGRRIPIDDSAAPIRNARGETIGVVLVFKDVTNRRTAETALRQSEEKYRLLVDNVNEAIYVAQDGRIRYANPMTASMSEYSIDELDSMDISVLIHPEDRDRITKHQDLKMRGKKTQGKDNCRIVTKSGEIRWAEFGYVRIEWQGRPATLNFLSDITERKLAELASQKAEEALRLSEEKYRMLVRYSSDPIFSFNPDETYHYVNEAFAKPFGKKPEDIIGKSPFDIFSKEEAEKRLATVRRVFKIGVKEDIEVKVAAKTGEILYFLTVADPIEDKDGKVLIVSCSSKNITDRKLAEEALRHSEQQYRVLAEASPEMIYLIDHEGTVQYVNGTAANMFGKEPDAIIGQSIRSLFPAKLVERHMKAIDRVMRIGETLTSEVLETFPTGQRWIEARLAPVKNDLDVVTGVLGLSQDISDRKRTEEALRESQALYHSFVEQLPNAVFRKDLEDRYVMVNPQFCKLKGVKAEDFLGKTPMEVAKKESPRQGKDGHATKYAAQGEEIHERIKRTGKAVETEEKYPAADGGKQYMHVIRMPVFDSEEKIIGTQGILFDITDRKRAEEALRNSEALHRSFAEKLTTLTAVTNDLSVSPTFDDLCRNAVQYGRERLGFDRLGFWFMDDARENLVGSFGTDEKGIIRDERLKRMPVTQDHLDMVEKARSSIVVKENIELFNESSEPVGRGDLAVANLWNGETIIGNLYVDNLIQKRPFTETDHKVLTLYASVLGHLCTLKQTEESLRESEGKFRKLFEDHAAVKLLIDPDSGSIEDANNAAADYYGWSREELKRMKIGQINTLPHQLIQKEMENAKSLKRIQFEFQHRRKDGSIREVEVYSSSIHVGDKDLLHSIIHDITERKHMEEKLRESESSQRIFAEKLTTLMNTTNELSTSPTFDELCRNAVEFGRERFGFDRFGLWFINEDGETLTGSFGTDEKGGTRDERHVRLPISQSRMEIVWRGHVPLQLFEDQDLYDESVVPVGKGSLVIVNLWNGERVIGNLCADNLFNHRPFNEFDKKILNLYATVLGHLCTLKQLEESLRQSETEQRLFAEKLALIVEMSNILSAVQSFDDLCREAVENTRDRLGFDRASLWFIDKDRQNMTGSFGTDEQGRTRDERHVVLSPIHERILKATQKGESPIKLFDDGVFNDKGNRIAEGTLAISNLWNGERAIGVLCVDNKIQGRPFTETDKKTLTLFASVLGHLCTLKQAESQNKHLTEVLKAIRDVNQLITHERDPRRLIQGTCDILQQTRNYELAVIMTTEPGADEIHPSAWAGIDLDRLSFETVRQNGTALSRGPSASAIRTGETTLFRDVQRDPSTEPWHDALRQLGIHSIISVPIRQQGQLIGALSVASKGLEAFNREETELLEEMASDISFALESIEMELDRHLAEESVRRSEERYRTLVESIIDYTYHVQVRDGKVVSTTHGPGCVNVTGFMPEEYLTEPLLWHRMVHDEDKAAVTEQAEAILAGKPVNPIEHRIIHKNGTIRWIRNTPVPRYNADGCLLSYDGVVLDITEKKRADEALWESVEKINSIFRAAPTGIGVVVNRVITEANERLCEMSGYAREALIGQSARVLYPTDEDFEFVGREKYRQIAEKGTGTVETRWRKKDGAVIDVLLSSTPINPSDLTHGVTFTALDITERKLMEETLRQEHLFKASVIESVADGLSVCHEIAEFPFVQFTIWNKRMKEITGYSLDDINRLGWYQSLYPDPEIQAQAAGRMQRMRYDDNLRNEEWEITRIDGAKRLISISTSLVMTSEEKPHVLALMSDITESIQAEKTLRMSERKFRTFIEQSVEGFGLVDEEGRIIEWNYALGQITGLSRDEVLGLYYWDIQDRMTPTVLKTPEQYEQTKAILQQILKTGRMPMDNPTQEMVILRSDGENRQVRHTAFTIKTDKGYRIGSITQDITEQKQIADLQKESELRYRTLADSGLALIWTSDVNKKYDYFNKPWLDFTGRALDHEMGDGWAESVHPDDLDRCIRIYTEAFDKREPFNMEYRLRHRSGDYRWIVDSGTPRIDTQGRFIGYIGHCLDITVRKQAEKIIVENELKIRCMLDSSPNAIVITDDKGVIQDCNQATLQMHRYSDKSELIGKNSMELISPKEREKAIRMLEAVFEKGYSRNMELTLVAKDGTPFPGELSASVVKDASGKPKSFVTIASDVSERKRTEDALRLRNQELERFERLTVGRELKMAELKKEIALLKKPIGKKEKPRTRS